MGNVINKDNDTINWNNVKTDKISESTGPLFLSDDSKLLASKLVLNIPDVEPSESEHLDIEKIFNKYQVVPEIQKNGSELSDTSPFISSEMYKYLMNKNQLNDVKVGGQLKQNGGAIDEDSSTSSTSSSEEIGSKGKHNDKASKKHKKETHKKQNNETKESEESEENEVEDSDLESSGGASDNLSYVSSSAHEGEASENSSNSQEESKENSNESTSESKSTQSVSNGNNEIPPSSINTSDINMISESS
jgi:hypothetical protein